MISQEEKTKIEEISKNIKSELEEIRTIIKCNHISTCSLDDYFSLHNSPDDKIVVSVFNSNNIPFNIEIKENMEIKKNEYNNK